MADLLKQLKKKNQATISYHFYERWKGGYNICFSTQTQRTIVPNGKLKYWTLYEKKMCMEK